MNEQELSDLLHFASEFSETKVKEQQKLPFHLNLIDQLHINENAHSRILMHLLRYKDKEGKHVFLYSLIELICKKKQKEGFGVVLESIQNPSFTHDKEKIDLWVRDENYAIIFENKVYNAVDQEAQLCRYIDKTNKRYKLENIFVIYLPKYDKEPDRQSWGNFEESFRPRYAKLSYYYDILPWLKDNVRPRIEDKELFLQTTIIQYIDYLEGLFKKREIDKTMNMELNKLIEKHLDLLGKPETEKVDKLMNEIHYVEEVASQMKFLLDSSRQKIFKTWQEQTETKYSQSFMPNKKTKASKGWYITDVTIIIDGKKAVVYLGEDSSYLYCGFYFDLPLEERRCQNDATNRIMKILNQTLSNEEKEFQPNNKEELFVSYNIMDIDAYSRAYIDFCKIVDELTNSL